MTYAPTCHHFFPLVSISDPVGCLPCQKQSSGQGVLRDRGTTWTLLGRAQEVGSWSQVLGNHRRLRRLDFGHMSWRATEESVCFSG